VLLPADNEPDIEEIPENVRQQMEFVLLKRLEDVLYQVLVTEPGGLTKADAEKKASAGKEAAK
jgi:ATP-dependent Lon protease